MGLSRLWRRLDRSNDPWELYDELTHREWEDLDARQRGLVALGELRAEVNANGFEAYFSHWWADKSETAVMTAEAADCPELAELVRQGWEIAGFEAGAIPECLERARLNEDLPPGAFDDLDRTYYRLEESTDLDAVMRRWLDQR